MNKPIDVQAIYADNVSITIMPHGVRMSFGEAATKDTPEVFRTAIYMPISMAGQFRQVFNKLMDEHAKQVKKKPNVVQN